ncbi:MAG: DUF4867 family protein [Oscillospiraceae bacterium]|nr:DUF4867 family protein [Oscillospiraceae bacterium]
MKFYSVFDEEFADYGQVLEGYDTKGLIAAMNAIPLPAEGVDYKPSIPELEKEPIFKVLREKAYGDMPLELGMCWGHNTKLNCLEYHRDSEINIGTEDFVLLLAKRGEIRNGRLDTAKVKAFKVPAGTVVEVFATALHYAPCHLDDNKGFRVAVGLPLNTNTDYRISDPVNDEDRLLWARNKWLIAHADSAEAKDGAYVGLDGENIDIAK